MGLFQRAPYPATFFLDPLGYYGQSLLKQRIGELKDRQATPEQLAGLDRLRQHFCGEITQKAPFEALIAPYRKRFSKLLLLPLQYNGYFTFDSICRYRSQTCSAGRRRTSDLRERFSHAIIIPETERFQNPSDLLMPFIDGVATVTSITGLKALFWRKTLITLGTPYLDWLDDATDLEQVGRVLDLPYHPAKDGALAWFLFCYSIPQHFNGRNNWTRDLIGRLLSQYRGGRLDAMFSEPIEAPERLSNELIRVTNRNFPTADEERCLLEAVKRLAPDQRTRLLAPPSSAPQLPFPPQDGGRRLVFLYASGRWNASGLYLQDPPDTWCAAGSPA